MQHRSLVLWLALLWMATTAPVAFGWQISYCDGDKIQWQRGNPRIRASAVGFPAGNVATTALQAVIDRWNNSPADFRFWLTFNDRSVGLDNGQNEVWFSDSGILDGAPAVAFFWDDCGDFGLGDGDSEIEEQDVVFACDSDWDCDPDFVDTVDWYFGTDKTRMDSYGGRERSFRTTAMHEFGHALGLLHEDGEYNIMGGDRTHIHANGDTATAYPGEDASDGAVELYSSSAIQREDVAVVHWRYTGTDGEYSVHRRTLICDNAGACDDAGDALVFSADGCDPAAIRCERWYHVDNGQEIQVQFTYENNGSTDQEDVQIGFYLSTNNFISLFDTRLGGRTYTLNRNSVMTTSETVTLPANLVSGTDYYVGVIVDEDDGIDEVYENNNATYIGIRVN
ncbi:MAG: CARDB domain-containing protein [Deltaproteobacteria bacterium]|nr:CARDB domain-containing protein [Deltaproteobacteria bacterium]